MELLRPKCSIAALLPSASEVKGFLQRNIGPLFVIDSADERGSEETVWRLGDCLGCADNLAASQAQRVDMAIKMRLFKGSTDTPVIPCIIQIVQNIF